MHSYADTFELPVIEKFDGKEITLPILSQRDLLPWIAEETTKQQDAARKNAPPAAVKDNARSKWMNWVDNMEVTPSGLQPVVFRAMGTIRVLEISLKKTGLSDEEIAKFIDSRPAKDNEMLAVRVCGLFRKDEIAALYPDSSTSEKPPLPNDPTPAQS